MTSNNDIEKILEPFRIARKLEEEGRAFFQEAANKASSKLVKETFEFLCREEDKHIAKLDSVYKALELSDGKELPDTEDSKADEILAEFNQKLSELRDKISHSVSDIEAYEVALKFENGAEDFYELKMNEATDPRIKRFYKWLIDEEMMHARILRSCIMFANDPTEWFKKHR